jgi:predicted ATPase/class 3 adenylate cyclase
MCPFSRTRGQHVVDREVLAWRLLGSDSRGVVTQPTGTVTLLFTDVEGSTRLLGKLGAERYAQVLGLHRRLLREAFVRQGGYEVGTEGDSFFVAFSTAEDAVVAAGGGQRALAVAAWPDDMEVRVRMGVHSGEPLVVGPGYVGMDVHRAARVMSAAHGGQVLVSETTQVLVDGVELRDLGPHRLKDMLEPIVLYQLVGEGLREEFPPLRSLHQTNLPVAAWPLLGREWELEEIRDLIAGGARLVTLTGPGGSGKTRLSLQAAAEISAEFRDGVFFVGLAPLRETEAVLASVAVAVGLQADNDVVAWLASKRVLLVLDNLEHLQAVEMVVSQLLVGEVVVLATSRAPLHLNGERELPVDPLAREAAVELFVSRAAAAGRQVEADATVIEVCRRLDNLPLALELAAARAKLLSPTALLERLDEVLPLLSGGPRDLPERQRTQRATIEWSYDLLNPDARAAFRRLSVFRGPFTLDAAETITGADLDQVATLLDQSLLKPHGDDRFFLLETLREYAREQLDEAGETGEHALRHARYYLARLEQNDPVLHGPRRGELFAWFAIEEDNLRAMLDRLVDVAAQGGARATELLTRYWVTRGAHMEAQQRLAAVLATNAPTAESRAALLHCLAEVEEWLGHLDASEAAAQEAIRLAEATGQERVLADALRDLAWVLHRRGDTEGAIGAQARALEVLPSSEERRRALALHDLGVFLDSAGRRMEARTVLREAADEARAIGYFRLEVDAMTSVADLDLRAGDFDTAHRAYTAVAARENETTGIAPIGSQAGLGWAALGLDRRLEARSSFAHALDQLIAAAMTSHYDFSHTLGGIALAAEPKDARRAARLRGAVTALRAQADFSLNQDDLHLERRFEQPLIDALGTDAFAQEHQLGATMSLDDAVRLARSLCGTAAAAENPV